MENKQSKRRWKIPVLFVSAICILLASSFVFHTTAEASVLTYALYGATFTSSMRNDGTAGTSIDTSLITDYSITSSNQYVSNDTYDTGTLEAYSGTPVYVAQMPDCKYAVNNGGTVTLYKTNGTETVNVGSDVVCCFIPGYYIKFENNGYGIYSLDGELFHQTSLSGSIYLQGFFFFNSYYFVLFSNSSGVFVTVLSDSFVKLQTYTLVTGNNAGALCCALYGDKILCGANSSELLSFDTETFQTSFYKFTSPSLNFFNSALIFDGVSLFLFKSGGYYLLDLSTVSSVQYSFPVSFQTLGTRPKAWYCFDSVFVTGSTSILKLSKSNSYYYDFGMYAANYIQNAKYVNFSVKSSTSVNGGDMVGIKLDYNLSPEYLSTLSTYGLRLTGCTMLASIDDSSAGIPNFGFSPIVVKVNGTAVPRYSTSYDLIKEHNGIYLYSFVSSVDFQGSTKINSLEIYLNCYIPEQLSKHSFSLPVSPIELYLEPAGGGGGGESSDTSSGGTSSGGGGGGGTSSDTSSDGDVSVPDEGGMLTFYKLSHYNQTQFIESVPSDGITKVSVFMGGFEAYYYQNHNTYGAVTGYITINYANAPTKVILLDFAVQGWSHYPSLTSVHYPTFTGTLIEVDHLFGDAIYLTDLVPYGQARVLDYDGFTYALVNYLAPDAYISVTQDSLNKIKVNVNQGGTGSYKLFPGKIARYKMSGFDGSTSWEDFEFDDTVFLSRSDFQSDGYDSLMLQIYMGEYPPYDPDFEAQLRDESLKREELENAANSAFADYSYDPQDKADFLEAAMSFDSALNNTGAHELFRFIDKMWNSTPVLGLFIAVTCSCAIIFFFVRKL